MATRKVPKPRKPENPPKGEFIDNGPTGTHFIQARHYLWQFQPSLQRWIVIDG